MMASVFAVASSLVRRSVVFFRTFYFFVFVFFFFGYRLEFRRPGVPEERGFPLAGETYRSTKPEF